MFVKAKKILASELMYAKGMDEDECSEWLEGVLTGHRRERGRRRRPAAKPKAKPAAKAAAERTRRPGAGQPGTRRVPLCLSGPSS